MPTKKNTKKSKIVEITRPPIVTVMGHVDHGKTTLLDAIRQTRVQQQEKGGITQSIGAYQATIKSNGENKSITFIDTPGHEAFTAMRARGAGITDIVVLVVAANEGTKPQTIEAINHAKQANVPMIVAVNKIDMPGASVDRVKEELSKYDLLPEDWGGQTIYVPISAKQKTNLDSLLEMILLVAEMAELKVKATDPFTGVVIESHLDPKRGAVATIIVQSGTLKRGETIYAGEVEGHIRSLFNDQGKLVNEAGPSTPVELLGFKEVLPLGAKLTREKVADTNHPVLATVAKESMSLSDLWQQHNAIEQKKLKLIIKAETQGALEAVVTSIAKIDPEKIELVHQATGAITESDVLLAKVSEATIIGFRLRLTKDIMGIADREKVDIKVYELIYELLDAVKELIAKETGKELADRISGRAKILRVFEGSDNHLIAGIKVNEGILHINKKIKIRRNDEVVKEAKIKTMKHLKADVNELKVGMEGGLTIDSDFVFQDGDQIEVISR